MSTSAETGNRSCVLINRLRLEIASITESSRWEQSIGQINEVVNRDFLYREAYESMATTLINVKGQLRWLLVPTLLPPPLSEVEGAARLRNTGGREKQSAVVMPDCMGMGDQCLEESWV